MADEAVLRIILDDAGKAGGRTTTAAGGATPSVSAGATPTSTPNESRQQNEVWSALRGVIPLLGAISPLLSAAVNLLTTLGKTGSGIESEQRKTTEATNSVRRSVDNLSRPRAAERQTAAATAPVAEPIHIPRALPANIPEVLPADIPEVLPVKAEVPMALSTPEDYLPEHENMTPDRAGRSVRDRLIASGMTDTAEIQRRSAEVSKYVEETSQNRLNVYNRVLEQTGSTDKAKAAAAEAEDRKLGRIPEVTSSANVPNARPAKFPNALPSNLPEVLPANLPDAQPIEAKSASEIASRFNVPSAGTGTAAGPKGFDVAGNISKIGVDAGATEGIAGGSGMLTGIMDAVPYAAALFAAHKAVTGAIKGTIGSVGNAVSGIASANADPSLPVEKFGGALSDASDKLGIFGGAALVGGESLKALAGVMQALDATAQRYGEYSAPIAQAQAIAEARHTMGDLRRAQEISPEMVRYIQAQTDLQEKVEDIKIRLLVKITPVVTRIVEILEIMMTGGENIVKGIELLALPLSQMTKIFGDWFGWEQDNDKEPPEDPTTILFDPRFEQGGLGTPRSPGFTPDL